MTTQDWLEAFLRAGAADVLSAATIHIYPFEPGLQNLGQKRGSKGTEVAEVRTGVFARGKRYGIIIV